MPSSSTAQPAPSSSQNTPNVFRNSSNLYLITFLATLFLLLFVSCAIVLRSFLLRRRYERHLDEAYAAGIILAPQAQGSRNRRYGHKPKLYTSWVVQGGEEWMGMMPVSALPVQVKRRNNTHRSSLKQVQEPPSFASPTRSVWPFFRGIPPDHITRQPAINFEKPLCLDRLQVAVLIAMPSANKPSNGSRSSIDKTIDPDFMPNVVFGVTRVPYKHSNQIT